MKPSEAKWPYCAEAYTVRTALLLVDYHHYHSAQVINNIVSTSVVCGGYTQVHGAGTSTCVRRSAGARGGGAMVRGWVGIAYGHQLF